MLFDQNENMSCNRVATMGMHCSKKNLISLHKNYPKFLFFKIILCFLPEEPLVGKNLERSPEDYDLRLILPNATLVNKIFFGSK